MGTTGASISLPPSGLNSVDSLCFVSIIFDFLNAYNSAYTKIEPDQKLFLNNRKIVITIALITSNFSLALSFLLLLFIKRSVYTAHTLRQIIKKNKDKNGIN
jgi:hypothetical protein